METAATSRKRKSPPLGKRTWTPEDENYLAEKWGYASVPAIAKKLKNVDLGIPNDNLLSEFPDDTPPADGRP